MMRNHNTGASPSRPCYHLVVTTLASNTVGRVLEPIFRALPDDVAKRIASLEADEALQSRIETLARKANEGELTDAEQQEYAAYVEAGDILATLQALARRRLRQESA